MSDRMKVKGKNGIFVSIFVVIIFTAVIIGASGLIVGAVFLNNSIKRSMEDSMLVTVDIADRYVSREIDILKIEAGEAARRIRNGNNLESIVEDNIYIGAAIFDHSGLVEFFGVEPNHNLHTERFMTFAFNAFSNADFVSNTLVENIKYQSMSTTMYTSCEEFVMYISAPIGDGLVLAVALEGLYFSHLLAHFEFWYGHIVIDDNEGTILVNSRDAWVLERRNFIALAETNPDFEDIAAIVRRGIAGERGTAQFSISDMPRIAALRPITGSNENWFIMIIMPLDQTVIAEIPGGIIIIAVIMAVLSIIAAAIAAVILKRPYVEVDKLRADAEITSIMLSTLFDSIPDLIFAKDLSLCFTQCNKSLTKHLNRRKEDIIGKTNAECLGVSDELAAKFDDFDRKVINDRHMFVLEEYLPRHDGTLILYEIVITPIMLNDSVVGILIIARDITKRKESERELAMQAAMLNALFDSVPDHIFTKNLDLKYMNVNNALAEYFGQKKEAIIGQFATYHEGADFSEEEASGYNERDRAVIRECTTLVTEETVSRLNGSKKTFETIKAPLIIDGNVIGILGIARDITKRKELEQSIASKYAYTKKMNDSLAEITKSPIISAGDLKIAADIIAEKGCDVLNSSRIGIWKFSEEKNTLESLTMYVASTGQFHIENDFDLSFYKENAYLLKTERIVKIDALDDGDVNNFLVYNPSLCAILEIAIYIDGKLYGSISIEQERCEQYPHKREWMMEEQIFASSLADFIALAVTGHERHKAREAAEAANQSKSSFLANMSHEIRTPMNAILGVTEIMMHDDLPVEIEKGLSTIYNSCDLLLCIINDILDFSKIEAGKLDIVPKQYEIASLINDSAHLNVMRINSKPIEFEVIIDENISAKLIGDALRIKQILNNLLSNAFKYTDIGKVTLSTAFEPLVDESSENDIILVLSVRDTGHGMTQEQQDKLFYEYSRFHEERNTSTGTGLGLTITQRLVKLMNGEMQVTSEPEKGSLFVVRLPQKTVNGEVIGSEIARNIRKFGMNCIGHNTRSLMKRDLMPYGRVLIVDDVETNLYVASGLMKLYSLQIDTALSGRDAINKIKDRNIYDIIFMDHMMPGMDGIEATANIRELGYSEPIIALTANAVTGQSDMFLQNGFDDFIAKPIDVRQLDFILNKYVRDKQPPEVIEVAQNQASSTKTNEGSSDDAELNDFIKAVGCIDEINTKIGLSRVSNMKNMYRDTLFMFTEKLLSECGGMIEALEADDFKEFSIYTHTMKALLSTIGARQLSENAAELEIASKNNDKPLCNQLFPSFKEKLLSLHEQLAKLFVGAENNSKKEQGNVEELAENIKKALAASENFDSDTAHDIIKNLLRFDFGADINSMLENAVIAFDDFNYEKAVEILNGFAGGIL